MCEVAAFRRELHALASLKPGSSVHGDRVGSLLHQLLELADKGLMPFDEWEQRCLASAVEHLRRGSLDVVSGQMMALFQGKARGLLSFMPSMPAVTVAELRRQASLKPPW